MVYASGIGWQPWVVTALCFTLAMIAAAAAAAQLLNKSPA
jgi:hypothetical protein